MEIVKELKKLRSLNSKTYLMDDGSYTAIVSRMPVHYSDENGSLHKIDVNIENRKVNKTIYEAELLTDCIGYTITNKKDKCRTDVKLVRIGDHEEIQFVEPKYEENKAIWEEIVPGIDVIIQFFPYTIKFWKIIKNEDAPRQLEFLVIEDEKNSINVSKKNISHDAKNRKAKVTTSLDSPRTFVTSKTQKRVREYSYIHTFDGESIDIDKKTRVRSLKKSEYPVSSFEGGDSLEKPEYPIRSCFPNSQVSCFIKTNV